MVSVPPRWAIILYAELWVTFQEKSFTKEMAFNVISRKNKSKEQVFSYLKKNGWLTINNDPSHAKKSIYILKSPTQIVMELGSKK